MKILKNINFDKLKSGLEKTRSKIFTSINETITGKAQIDDLTLDELEEKLISADIGVDISLDIIEKTRKLLKNETDRSKVNVFNVLKTELHQRLTSYSQDLDLDQNAVKNKPYVILIVGVNGAGKTTTIGKLAYQFKNYGNKVIIGAADTFRAAANDQLEIWAQRADVPIVSSSHGEDPSSIAFETLTMAKKNASDIVIIDTAGRLHTKSNLMVELEKIRRVLSKVIPGAPHEVWLVVDGNAGQNAIVQAREFKKYSGLTGLIITKLDGTSKGGSLFQICSELNIPIRYIGVGESIDDLQTFEPDLYIEALFKV
ncbi:MAG: signal recognition particle-docking protein FtsY [Ignavibacteriales bacterium]|nr:signal recognition particle-docking protein FtsY [Ignavibacteriales bacterium]